MMGPPWTLTVIGTDELYTVPTGTALEAAYVVGRQRRLGELFRMKLDPEGDLVEVSFFSTSQGV